MKLAGTRLQIGHHDFVQFLRFKKLRPMGPLLGSASAQPIRSLKACLWSREFSNRKHVLRGTEEEVLETVCISRWDHVLRDGAQFCTHRLSCLSSPFLSSTNDPTDLQLQAALPPPSHEPLTRTGQANPSEEPIIGAPPTRRPIAPCGS